MAEVTIQPIPTAFFIPPHVEGDREFKVHGPVTYVRVDAQIRNDHEVWAQVYMRAREAWASTTSCRIADKLRA